MSINREELFDEVVMPITDYLKEEGIAYIIDKYRTGCDEEELANWLSVFTKAVEWAVTHDPYNFMIQVSRRCIRYVAVDFGENRLDPSGILSRSEMIRLTDHGIYTEEERNTASLRVALTMLTVYHKEKR